MAPSFFGRRGQEKPTESPRGDEPAPVRATTPPRLPGRQAGSRRRPDGRPLRAPASGRGRPPRVEPELESFLQEEAARAAANTHPRGPGRAHQPEWEKPSTTTAETPSSTAITTRRRRRGGRPKAVEAAAPPPTPEPPAAPPPVVPARRRRRGGRQAESQTGVARVAPAGAVAAEAPAQKPAGDLADLPGLLTRQGAVVEAYAAEQLRVLQGMHRSLGSLEARLSSALGRGAPGQGGLPLPRVGIFIDVPNVMYAAERRGISIDFGRLLSFLARGRELVRASAYAPISDDPQIPLAGQKFVQPFVDHGYRIVTKPLKRFADGSIKANFDVELAIDVLTMSDRLDVVSLVSGDGDFRRLVELVASKGVRVEVVAFAESTSADLRAVADDYVDLGANLTELQAR